jgi:hypothetical protein
MGKYDPLFAHLRRQTSATYEMSFRDIERLLTAFLPHGAERAEWWSNERAPGSRRVQSRAWLDAGYSAFLVKGAGRVRFERR